MNLEDVKVGMKVKLLNKHVLEYNNANIEDFYNFWIYIQKIQEINKQGYMVVTNICGEKIMVNDSLSSIVKGWCLLPSDLEPYEEQ